MKEKRRSEKIFLIVTAIACLVFYISFPMIDGAVICKDSPSYMSMEFSREPIYPTFLTLMRALFGQDSYTFGAVIVQSLLASYASWRLAKLIYGISDSIKCGIGAAAFQFMVSLLNRFIARRGSSYIECIMTEGICLSLFVLFTVQLYLFLDRRKISNLTGTAVYAFILIDVRKQMMITVLMMIIMFFIYILIREHELKKFLLLILIIPLILVSDKLADRTYNLIVRGAFVEHGGNGTGFLTSLLYSSDKDKDAEAFKDPELRSLYCEIMDESEKQRLLYEYAGKGFTDLSTHYADNYDAIQYGIIDPVIQDYVSDELGITDCVQKALSFDEICGRMSHVLIGRNMRRMFRVFVFNSMKGFINSVLRMNSILNWAAMVLYGIYAGLMYRIKRDISRYGERGRKILLFAEVVICGIIVNSLVVGVMIFAQPRYMIYSMGAFYTAMMLMISEVMHAGRKVRTE